MDHSLMVGTLNKEECGPGCGDPGVILAKMGLLEDGMDHSLMVGTLNKEECGPGCGDPGVILAKMGLLED